MRWPPSLHPQTFPLSLPNFSLYTTGSYYLHSSQTHVLVGFMEPFFLLEWTHGRRRRTIALKLIPFSLSS